MMILTLAGAHLVQQVSTVLVICVLQFWRRRCRPINQTSYIISAWAKPINAVDLNIVMSYVYDILI